MQLELRLCQSLSDIPESAWQSLLRPEDGPFVSWAFLEGLERTGCVSPERGWWPCHLTAWQKPEPGSGEEEQLLAAAPAYVKNDGMGDFSRDWAMHDIVHNFGVSLYPKLVIGVPFTPAYGRRILARPDIDPELAARILVDLGMEACRANSLSSISVLYHLPEERRALESAGLATRVLIQYHWHNRDYSNMDDWLGSFKAKKRHQIRRERKELERQGIEIETLRGEALREAAPASAREAYALYATTCDKYMWGGTYLSEDFFELMFERLPENVELVTALRRDNGDRRLVAGAINLATPTHLYGRYWGCFEEHRFLHFNVCLYHSIEECIDSGIQVFEGGAGGEHKLSRGFEPRAVYTSHRFLDENLDRVMNRALRADAQAHERHLERWRENQERP